MVFLILYLGLQLVGIMAQFNLNRYNMCSCNQIFDEADCTAQNCAWDSTTFCSLYNCSIPQLVSNQTACNQAQGCGYSNDECANFTYCAYYKVNGNGSICATINPNCYYNPKISTTSCSYYTAPTPARCSTYDTATCTNQSYCSVENGTCSDNTCASYNTTFCSTNYISKTYVTQICAVVNGVCTDAPDSSWMNHTVCNNYSQNTYTWMGNMSLCMACGSSFQGSILMTVPIFLYLMHNL